jgi:hypothetical protein
MLPANLKMELHKTILFALFISISLQSFACQCKTKTLSELQKLEKENSEYIFIGEVLEINESDDTYKIKVLESLNNKNIQGKIFIGKNWKYCGPIISEIGKWIVYGNIKNEFLTLNECGISRAFNSPTTLTDRHIPKPPKLDEKINKSESDKIYKRFLNKAIKDLEIEIIALRKVRDKNKKYSR